MKELRTLDKMSEGLILRHIEGNLIESIEGAKFIIIGENKEQFEEVKSQVPAIKELCMEVNFNGKNDK
jgi:hypothetical protein